MHPSKEVSGVFGVFGLIHSGKSDLGIDVDAGEDVSSHAGSQHRDPIERDEKPTPSLFLELSNAASRLIVSPSRSAKDEIQRCYLCISSFAVFAPIVHKALDSQKCLPIMGRQSMLTLFTKTKFRSG